MASKRCSKCKEIKDVSEFCKCSSKKDGLYTSCKSCKAKSNANWRIKHRQEILKREKLQREKNKDKIKKYKENYDKTHREQNLKYSREYEKVHHNERRAKKNEWYRTDYGKKLLRAAAHRRRLRLIGMGTFTASDIERQGISQKWRCWWCGKDCKDKYHVDHLIPISRGGHNNPTNIVIACPLCNNKKYNKLPYEFCGKLF